MKTLSLPAQNRPGIATMRSQATSAVWSGYTVKYGPHTGFEDRQQEVRG